ncbi:MAG: helix-turn-helix domain-containing protein [Actinomycetia bacterium]|nr:helix-turn-helix domain-containing protein [Actinomycetes bacterium]
MKFEPAVADGDTRSRVLRSLLEDGPATATGLAGRLGLTPAGIRRHLDALAADGQVVAGERSPYGPGPRRGRGRPARVYAVTEAGRAPFPHAYDDLAANVLRYLAANGGPGAVEDFARTQVAALEARYREVVSAAAPGREAAALAAALRADGYAASSEPAPAARGEQLCQHHCPVAHVAAEFPQLCEAETEAFSRLLGRPVQRLATIGHGDHVCTTFVPARPAPSERTAS